MSVFVVAGGHAPPPLEPAEAPFHGLARLVSFRVVGLGIRAPLPGRNDGLDALLLQPRAEGITVIGPVGDQAGQRRVRLGFHQGPGLGAVVALPPVTRRRQGPAAAIRQDVDLGAETAPAATAGGIRPFVFGGARRAHVRAHDRAVQPHGEPIWIGLQVGHQVQPDAPVAPVGLAAIDRIPLAVFGRQLMPRGAPPCHSARRFHKKATMGFLVHAYIGTGNQKSMNATPLGIGHRVIDHRGNAQREG